MKTGDLVEDVDVGAADDEFYGVFTCVDCGAAFTRERWLGEKRPWNRCNKCYNDDYVERMCEGYRGEDWGWAEIVRGLHRKITELQFDYRIEQIKEKFGGLRFYIGPVRTEVSKQIWALIDEAESASYKTCEVCGKPGKSRTGGWIKTFCDEHADGREPFEEDDNAT